MSDTNTATVDDLIQTCKSLWKKWELWFPNDRTAVEIERRQLKAMIDEIERLRTDNERLINLTRRARTIITDAIMHGMPVTAEVAAVRNEIVIGTGGER